MKIVVLKVLIGLSAMLLYYITSHVVSESFIVVLKQKDLKNEGYLVLKTTAVGSPADMILKANIPLQQAKVECGIGSVTSPYLIEELLALIKAPVSLGNEVKVESPIPQANLDMVVVDVLVGKKSEPICQKLWNKA